jgi:hypothetical protein
MWIQANILAKMRLGEQPPVTSQVRHNLLGKSGNPSYNPASKWGK